MNQLRIVTLALPAVLGIACAHQTGTGAMGTGERQAQGSTGSQATAQDPLMRPGPAIQGHASDQIVSGKIAQVGTDSVSIATDQGDTRTLSIVPQTSVQLNGEDASSTDLKEGLPVRASFDQVSGDDVAVQIWAGKQPQAQGERTGDDFSQPGDPSTREDTQLPGSGEK